MAGISLFAAWREDVWIVQNSFLFLSKKMFYMILLSTIPRPPFLRLLVDRVIRASILHFAQRLAITGVSHKKSKSLLTEEHLEKSRRFSYTCLHLSNYTKCSFCIIEGSENRDFCCVLLFQWFVCFCVCFAVRILCDLAIR